MKINIFLNGGVYKLGDYTEDILGRSNSVCKGFKVEIWLMYLRYNKKISVVGLEWVG